MYLQISRAYYLQCCARSAAIATERDRDLHVRCDFRAIHLENLNGRDSRAGTKRRRIQTIRILARDRGKYLKVEISGKLCAIVGAHCLTNHATKIRNDYKDREIILHGNM